MRTFFCLPIDAGLRGTVTTLSEALRRRLGPGAGSWVRPENFHVTVQFLGEIDPMLTVDLERLARGVAGRIEPFDLVVDRVGAFPSLDRPRVVWAGGEAPEAFVDLLRTLGRELAPLGFEEERRTSVTHITFVRLQGRPVRLEEAVAGLRLPMHVLRAEKLILMESQLRSGGAEYAPLFTVPLGGRRAV